MARGYATHPMTRRNPWRIALNIIDWQLRARIDPGDHEVKWIAGTRLVVCRGMTGATGNVYYGLAEFHDMAFALHLLRQQDLFVDVGANIGAYSVIAAGICGSHVVAVEPIHDTWVRLKMNLDLNGLRSRVEVIEACIGDCLGSVRMTKDLDTVNHIIPDSEIDAFSHVTVPMRTLDEVLDGRSPILIKIDTEGFEGNVLLGARHTLQSPSLLGVSVEGDASRSYPSLGGLTITGWMNKFGFVPISYNGATRAVSTDPLAYPMRNLLFARNLDECKRRLTTAKSIQVLGTKV
jgi:FkbM family methyltransferase